MPSEALRFVIQKHAASHLHFDLRLEYEGTFRSWAVPKGPSLDPKDRRMAMEVEDHPLDYGDFEGTIPKGQYGGGTVMLWDRGYWAPEKGFEKIGAALAKGELKFVMEGERMHGSWVIVRTKRDSRGKASWLLIKHRDEGAVEGNVTGPTDDDRSVASGRTMTEITNGKGRAAKPFMTAKGAAAGAVWQSNRDDSAPAGLIAPTKAKPVCQGQDRRQPAGLRRAAAGQAAGEAAGRAGLGARDQVRRLPHAAAHRRRQGDPAQPQGPRLVVEVSRRSSRPAPSSATASSTARWWRWTTPARPDFAALQAAISDAKTKDLVFFVFDQMFDGKEDLRPLPLSERKARLEAHVGRCAGQHPLRRPFHHRRRRGAAVGLPHGPGGHRLQAARRALPVRPQRKLGASRNAARATRWSSAAGRRRGTNFRSLIAGVNRDGELVHVGRIGTGFGRDTVSRILPRLKALETDEKPVQGQGRAEEGGGRPLGAARAGRRDPVRRLHRRRLDPPGLVQGPARGQAGRRGRGRDARAGGDDRAAASRRRRRRSTPRP